MLLALVIFTGCKSKKKPSLSGEEMVDISDFIDFFPTANLPYKFTDTSLLRKEKDSLLISYKVITQFVPDSVFDQVYGKGVKPKVYPLGKVVVSKGETYLFIKTVAKDKRAAFIVAFDKDNKYIAAMPALRPDQSTATAQSMVLDKQYTITKIMQRKSIDGSISEGKDVYVLNVDAKNFILIMTDALDDKITELINPIDTLPRKHKYAADYGTGKMNLVSIRDGRKPELLSFFVHFDKDNGGCSGELKGEAIIQSANTAQYREGGDPCILTFTFSANSVSIKEENCGNHRGLKCSFDGSFGKRKYVKPAPPKTEKPTLPKKPVKN